MISFICSSKYSSSILREPHTTAQVSVSADSGFWCDGFPRRFLPVGLVQDQDLNVRQLKARRVVKVIDQPTRCRY